jgi:hypothetical protein
MHESGTFVCFTPAGAGLLSGDSSGSHRNEIQTAASSTCVSLVSSPFNLMAFRRDACAPACAARIAAARGMQLPRCLGGVAYGTSRMG